MPEEFVLLLRHSGNRDFLQNPLSCQPCDIFKRSRSPMRFPITLQVLRDGRVSPGCQ